jgi:hypothetical protein
MTRMPEMSSILAVWAWRLSVLWLLFCGQIPSDECNQPIEPSWGKHPMAIAGVFSASS